MFLYIHTQINCSLYYIHSFIYLFIYLSSDNVVDVDKPCQATLAISGIHIFHLLIVYLFIYLFIYLLFIYFNLFRY